MVTTPTNEAGHGLPELPALPSLECGPDTGHLAIHTEDQIRRYAESYGRACYALALSRGVPEPVWIVNDLGELGVMVAGAAYFLYKGDNIVYEDAAHDDGTPMLYRIVGKREFGETCWPLKWVEAGRREDRYTEKLHYAAGLSFGNPVDGDWRPLPKAAPAAAGAQGEDEIDRAARRMGDSARSLLQDIAQHATHQPAAADGGVRERARALFDAMLAAPYGSTTMGDIVCAETTCSRLESAWLPILEAALSSHRQAGDDRPHVVRIPKEKRWVEGDSELLKWHADGYNSALSDVMSVNQGVSRLERSPDLSKFRELAERWRGEDARKHSAPGDKSDCADDLIALVEKGAGNG